MKIVDSRDFTVKLKVFSNVCDNAKAKHIIRSRAKADSIFQTLLIYFSVDVL